MLFNIFHLFFFFHFPALLSAFTRPTQYFINCGSSDYVNDTSTGRTFIGDEALSPNLTFPKQGRTAKATVNNTQYPNASSAIYQTARIFRDPSSSYVVDVAADQGNYVLRLHFFAFDSPENVYSSVFDVSVPGLVLLKDFRVSRGALVVKEFLLNVSTSKFVVYFNPKASSFAFVNALEVIYVVPEGFMPDTTSKVSVYGNSTDYDGILREEVLQPVHRINFGGNAIVSRDDYLWRTWEMDDSYLTVRSISKTTTDPSIPNDVEEYLAPNYVYQTAKTMQRNSTDSVVPNATWGFAVSLRSSYVVRAHFCDIIAPSISSLYVFNLYVYGNFAKRINPYDNPGITQTNTAFHYDFIVYSDDSGVLNISIGFRDESTSIAAYLNGLEVFEMMGKWESGYVVAQPKNNIRIKILAGTLAGTVSFLVIAVVVIALVLRFRKPKQTVTLDWSPASVFRSVEGEVSSSNSKLTDQTMSNLHLELKLPLAEIHFATNSFDEKLLIGKGGFGNVYRGVLRDGTQVAVKRSEPGCGQGISEFQTEIIVLSKIRHRHLVSLIGYCDERDEMILVYEFMEKGALRDHLYGSDLPPLSWKQRLEICIGAARGLHYLHRGSAGGIIHRDVKSTNILLDANYVAKVADFGLSKLGPPGHDRTHFSTGVKGTIGYLDPEYFKTQQLTEKSDVYSFGVVLLEVLCAKPAIDVSLPRHQMNLAEWGMASFRDGTIEKMIDISLAGQINPNSLRKFFETVEKCLREDDDERPGMGDVIWDLEYTLQLQQTGIRKETTVDSTTDASSVLMLSNVQRFPSFSMSFVGGDDSGGMEPRENGSNETSTDVFSQMSIKEAR